LQFGTSQWSSNRESLSRSCGGNPPPVGGGGEGLPAKLDGLLEAHFQCLRWKYQSLHSRYLPTTPHPDPASPLPIFLPASLPASSPGRGKKHIRPYIGLAMTRHAPGESTPATAELQEGRTTAKILAVGPMHHPSRAAAGTPFVYHVRLQFQNIKSGDAPSGAIPEGSIPVKSLVPFCSTNQHSSGTESLTLADPLQCPILACGYSLPSETRREFFKLGPTYMLLSRSDSSYMLLCHTTWDGRTGAGA